MRYEILDQTTQAVVNTVIATSDYMETKFPEGNYRLVEAEAIELDEPAPQPITVLAFRRRFTQAEKETIYTVAKDAVSIQVWLDDLNNAEEVFLDDPDIVYGVASLAASGILTQARADEILTP